MRQLWFLLLFVTTGRAAVIDCPVQDWYNRGCNPTTIVLLDASSHLDLISKKQYMHFVWDNMLSHWAFPGGQQVSYMSYGVDNSKGNPIVLNVHDACMQLDNVRSDMFQYGGATVSLTQAFQQLKKYYGNALQQPNTNILLFSAASAQAEIDSAGAFATSNFPNVTITVLALGDDFRPWKNFPALNVQPENPLRLEDNDLILAELLCNTCGGCPDGTGKWTAGTATPPTLPPTTPLPSTTTAAPAPGTDGPKCGNVHTGLWLDIMFLLDSSSGEGYDAMQDMLTLIIRNMGAVYIEKSGEHAFTPVSTRIGLATYSNKTTLYAKLYSMDGRDLAAVQLYYDDVPNTDLDDAIRTASAQFDDPKAHRPNAKKVIVIMGHDYEPGNFPMPTDAADTFKENGGIIIVYDYVGYDSVLQSLASPGFYQRSDYDSDGYHLINLLVLANCFCPPGTSSFTSIPGTNVPSSGCYFTKNAANYQAASNQCKLNNTGIISQNKNSIKTTFLQSQDDGKQIWSGAVLDSRSGTWEWANGQQVDMSTVTWLNTPQQGQSCAALATDGKWISTDCRNSYDFVCEIAPSSEVIVICPNQGWYNAGCNTKTAVLLDASEDLQYVPLEDYMQFVWKLLLPHWAFGSGQQLSFTSYGAAPQGGNPFVSTFEDACLQLDEC